MFAAAVDICCCGVLRMPVAVAVTVAITHGGNGFAQVGGHLGYFSGSSAKLCHGVGNIHGYGIDGAYVAVDLL